MINLLPEAHKRDIRAARTNVILARYLSILSGALGVLLLLVGASYILLSTTQQSVQEQVSENNNRIASYAKTRQEADQFRNDLASAKTIIDGEITYSQLIYNVANIVPKNVILDSLTLDSQTLGSKATMNASAKSYNDAITLKQKFIDNPELFSEVSFETLSFASAEGSTDNDPYPVKIALSVTIKKDAL